MVNCPWCEDVEAPPGSCPLHQGQSPREAHMRPRQQEVHIRRAEATRKLSEARRKAYVDGVKDGVVLTLFVFLLIAVVWLMLVVS